MVVTIRCECENLHTFSVVFGQHKGIAFVRTDVDLVAGKERSSSFSTMNKPFYSIAEMYARGLLKVTYPADDIPVCYQCRIYPVIKDPGELLKNKNPGLYIGWTISLEYVNEATNMEIHCMEITRPSKRELVDALGDVSPSSPTPDKSAPFKTGCSPTNGASKGSLPKIKPRS